MVKETLATVAALALAGLLMAQTSPPAALAGKVTSQQDGSMEGVVVGA